VMEEVSINLRDGAVMVNTVLVEIRCWCGDIGVPQ
jgi:hypothetical protein